MRLFNISCLGFVVLVATTAMAQPPPPNLAFTASQAEAGHIEFEQKCASCHMPATDGQRLAPMLIGPQFLSKWGHRRARDLFVRMRDGMPPIGVRPRGDGYANILAFLLRENGGQAGSDALDPLSYDRLTTQNERLSGLNVATIPNP